MKNNVYVYIGVPNTLGSNHIKVVYNTVFGTVSSEISVQDYNDKAPQEVAEYLSFIFSAGMGFCVWRDSYVVCASEEIGEAVLDMFDRDYDGLNVLQGSHEEYAQLKSGAHLRKDVH